jgi:hypothetical protein
VAREITAKNTINADYAGEMRNVLFAATPTLSILLSDYDQPAPANGLIFPMGHFLGFGKFLASGGSNVNQGTWSSNFAKVGVQENGLTSNTMVWDFAEDQAVGTIRSLFLYLDSIATRYPTITPKSTAWGGTPKWSVENKVLDVVTKATTTYYVSDLYAKTHVSRAKVNTLTLTGIARDVDSGHIFIFDAVDKKLYEYAGIDTPFIAANILNTYNCTAAYPGKGLIKGDYLYYLAGASSPLSTTAVNPTGATLYLFKYAYKTDAAPELIDTLTSTQAGFSQFTSGDTCGFMDDCLVLFNAASGSNLACPILRMVGNTPRIGFTGGYSSTTSVVQRIAPSKQILCVGALGSATSPINKIPPMAVSHLLLPEPIVKDAEHRLSVTYTISTQD